MTFVEEQEEPDRSSYLVLSVRVPKVRGSALVIQVSSKTLWPSLVFVIAFKVYWMFTDVYSSCSWSLATYS